MDVGGGLGIDYDGSQTDFESSVNYTLQEYANDVVYHIQNVCDEAEVPHPTIITESGRAIAAYHSVLVFNVLGVTGFGEEEVPQELPEDAEQPLIDLLETYTALSAKNLLESFHDAQQALDSALNLFSLGYLPLQQRSLAENIYWAICRRIQKMAKELDYFPEELEGAGQPAVGYVLLQLLVVPEHARQLGGEAAVPDHADPPPGRGADAPRRARRYLLRFRRQDRPVHRSPRREEDPSSAPVQWEAYYPGAFLVGAYQEILGDLHNLFGDTNAVHVRWATTTR